MHVHLSRPGTRVLLQAMAFQVEFLINFKMHKMFISSKRVTSKEERTDVYTDTKGKFSNELRQGWHWIFLDAMWRRKLKKKMKQDWSQSLKLADR